MSDATKAVFLSYAREDTDAARRVAEALRWADQRVMLGIEKNEPMPTRSTGARH